MKDEVFVLYHVPSQSRLVMYMVLEQLNLASIGNQVEVIVIDASPSCRAEDEMEHPSSMGDAALKSDPHSNGRVTVEGAITFVRFWSTHFESKLNPIPHPVGAFPSRSSRQSEFYISGFAISLRPYDHRHCGTKSGRMIKLTDKVLPLN